MGSDSLPASAELSARPAARSRYIVGPVYDWLLFLAPPALAMALAVVLGVLDVASERFWIDGRRATYLGLATGALVHAHLVAVVFRSHGNPTVLRRHKVRFLVVPPLLIAAMMLSEEVMLLSTVIVVFWDVYHSALQTFGFGRIYDARAGNDATVGRRLDLGLNLVLYIGPIVAGASMIDHIGSLEALDDLGTTFFSTVPVLLEEKKSVVLGVVLSGGVVYAIYYVLAYVGLARRGYKVAWPKVWLLTSTALCSIVAWGFNPWGLAFFVMNVFHAVQYLGLVWWSEGGRIKNVSGLKRLAPLAFLLLLASYGTWAELVTDEEPFLWAITQTVALMHFWYDGFVWSVSKRHV
ncbi:MAG: hypothetical protein HOW73_16305 [Polyangiaceae bacterium]|nr:hypothetical protein [Polyangiaceae bacterium]